MGGEIYLNKALNYRLQYSLYFRVNLNIESQRKLTKPRKMYIIRPIKQGNHYD